MPVLLTTVLNVLMSTLGKMLIKYLANSAVIEDLVMFGLEKLVKATDSNVDNEVLDLLKKQREKSDAEAK